MEEYKPWVVRVEPTGIIKGDTVNIISTPQGTNSLLEEWKEWKTAVDAALAAEAFDNAMQVVEEKISE